MAGAYGGSGAGGPYDAGYGPPPRVSGGGKSGSTALVFGILGLLCCGIFAVVAWIYGTAAVEDTRGTSEEGLARAGQVLGVIGTALWVLGLLIALAA